MEEIKCTCGTSLIRGEDIGMEISTNELGEEYSEIYYECPNCGIEKKSTCWGWAEYNDIDQESFDEAINIL